jgi:muramoyltetrapeptide carboxypeptidase
MSSISHIGIIGPSGIFSPERLEVSRSLVRSWGVESTCAPQLFAKHYFTAGTKEQRISDLQWAISSPNLDALWYARGGYGTIETLSSIDWQNISKPIIGFSDATAMLCTLYQNGGTAIHGPVLQSLADHADSESQAFVHAYLNRDECPPLRHRHLWGSTDAITAPITGGNLCVLSSMAGTDYAFKSDGHIVLLEDIAEPAYKIHRMLTQLIMSGSFDGAVAIGLGEFLNCHLPKEANYTLEDIILDALKPLEIPIYKALPFGHGPKNHLWKYGQYLKLSGEH